MKEARMLNRNTEIHSIGEALSVLDRAARDSADEVRQMFSNDFHHLRRTLSDLRPKVADAIREVGSGTLDRAKELGDRTVKKTKESIRQMDESVHASPWLYLCGTAASCAIAGYLYGRRNSTMKPIIGRKDASRFE